MDSIDCQHVADGRVSEDLLLASLGMEDDKSLNLTRCTLILSILSVNRAFRPLENNILYYNMKCQENVLWLERKLAKETDKVPC